MMKRLKLFANCIPVKGARRSLICDTQRNSYELIPNDLYALLVKHKSFTLDELVHAYGEEERETLLEYLHFLEQKEFIFWTSTPELFPPIEMKWDYYSEVSNAIIDWNATSNYLFSTIIEQLNAIGCEHIQLRFFDAISFDDLLEIFPLMEGTGILSVDVLTQYSSVLVNHHFQQLLHLFPRITQWIVHSAPKNETIENAYSKAMIPIIHTTEIIDSESHCGIIHPGYFTMNLNAFAEGQQFNSCLNKKISIDKKGQIKNCPSLEKSFGDIGQTTLKEALKKPGFKESWTVHKDQIEVCKDCEFRYICTDCRAYTEKNAPLGKPLKCNYNPYIAKWEV